MRTIVVIDYEVGNLFSVHHALTAAAHDAGAQVRIATDASALVNADAIVLPGVGHFAACAAALRARGGLIAAIENAVLRRGAAFLGICVGMQLLVSGSDEGGASGLGWIAGRTGAMTTDQRIPHMGWNTVTGGRTPLFDGIGTADMYFAHSYIVRPDCESHIAARCDYGAPFVAALGHEKIFGVQFHPEKSQAAGQAVLRNFVRLAL